MKAVRTGGFSFRTKIIITLIGGICVFSLVAFTGFNYFLKKRVIGLNTENVEQINLLRDQFYFSIGEHNGTIIRAMLSKLEADRRLNGVFLANAADSVVYSTFGKSLGKDTADIRTFYETKGDVNIKSYQKNSIFFNRVFIRLRNQENCYPCHSMDRRNLGMIIMDIPDQQTEKIVVYARRFGFIYTFILLLGIFAIVAVLHYRFIRSSLGLFREAIGKVNLGRLETRIDLPEARELAALSSDFNTMLETFERTTTELNHYHEQEMQEARKLATIGEMSARIAHEIRNPVTGITRALEILIKDQKEDHNKQILEEIQRQANRVEQAISNLLRYSRSHEVRLLEGDINATIRSLVFFLRHQALGKKVRFETDLEEGLPTVFFDPELIENVLLNLGFNAIKFIPENDGYILFKTWLDKRRNSIIVGVEDNGPGIPENLKNSIFKPFFTTHTKGTGLGLAISREIVEKHKGRIWFKNNEGPGCTFFLCLPLPKEDQHQLNPEP